MIKEIDLDAPWKDVIAFAANTLEPIGGSGGYATEAEKYLAYWPVAAQVHVAKRIDEVRPASVILGPTLAVTFASSFTKREDVQPQIWQFIQQATLQHAASAEGRPPAIGTST